ncbi:MAG: DoxX family protein [Actinomycetota bacterium]|nr:DoxX family protein [Actinomycetota bacterium]MDQ3575671.1 DoxX family protein [Actinomycetota bacterium]
MTLVRVIRRLARLMLSAIFVVGAGDALRKPEPRAQMVDWINLPRPNRLVQASSAGLLAGGMALALGVREREAAVLAFALLVPTTVGGHAFWREDDEQARRGQRIHFMKNLSILGALLYIATGADHRA